MINKIIHLDNDDVVLVGKDTFKVIRLKELIIQEISKKWGKTVDSYANVLSKISLGNNQDIDINEIGFKLTK